MSRLEFVGEVGTMPGTEGFTMACFKTEDVPVGTRLFATSGPQWPAYVPADLEAMIARQAQTIKGLRRELEQLKSIDYTALIEAASNVNKKWVPGSTACIAFKHGAEWFRDTHLTKCSQDQKHE